MDSKTIFHGSNVVVSNAVEKAIIKMVAGSEYSQHEQQCMIEEAKSIYVRQDGWSLSNGMLSHIFPTPFLINI